MKLVEEFVQLHGFQRFMEIVNIMHKLVYCSSDDDNSHSQMRWTWTLWMIVRKTWISCTKRSTATNSNTATTAVWNFTILRRYACLVCLLTQLHITLFKDISPNPEYLLYAIRKIIIRIIHFSLVRYTRMPICTFPFQHLKSSAHQQYANNDDNFTSIDKIIAMLNGQPPSKSKQEPYN